MHTKIGIPKWKGRKMWKWLFTFMLLIAALCLSFAQTAPAIAATHVVAEFTAVSGLWERINSGQYAQTFTTGLSDTHANAIQIMVHGYQWETPATIRVSITETTSGLPNDSVLCSGIGTAKFYNTLGWFQISLGDGASLAANTQYALVVTADPCPGFIDWNGKYAADYSGGTAYYYSGSQWILLPGVWSGNRAGLGFKVLNIVPDYSLTVNTNPAGIDSTIGSGLHEAGATVSIEAPHMADYSGSVYHFNGWTGATVADASSPSTTMTIPDSATTITANYIAQYAFENLTSPTGPPYGFGDWWLAQTFNSTSDHNVNAVSLQMTRDSSFAGTITVSIRRTDSNGCPTGADLVSGTIDVSSIPISASWVLIPMNGSCNLDNNAKYAVQLRGTGGPGYVCWVSGSGYTGGQAWFAQLNGTFWQTWPNIDFLFKILGDPPLNVPPVATAGTVTAAEDTAYTFAPANFTFTDADGDALTDVEISTLPPADKGSLKLSGTAITAGQQIPLSNIGNLIYQAPLNQNGTAYTSFTFKVKTGSTWSESTATMTINVSAVNDAPVAADQALTTNEDINLTVTLTGTDAEGDSLVYKVAALPVNGRLYDGTGTAGRLILAGDLPYTVVDSTHNVTYAPDENYNGTDSFAFKVNDGADDSTTTAAIFITVNPVNDTPVITGMVLPASPTNLVSIVNGSATFTDPDVGDSHSATWDWGDGTASPGAVDESNKSVTGSHSYGSPGIYSVNVTVTDSGTASDTEGFQFIVIYDPNDGFVTGGGWIESPAGALASDPLLTGKATFGFVSKYRKGANVPTGNTEFQFKAGNLNFKSTSYQWLVVAGAKGQFKGEGTINGAGNYGFMLTAIDGQVKGGGGVDKFRIKIWDSAGTIVYDNQMDVAEDADPSTALGGGSIVIHK